MINLRAALIQQPNYITDVQVSVALDTPHVAVPADHHDLSSVEAFLGDVGNAHVAQLVEPHIIV